VFSVEFPGPTTALRIEDVPRHDAALGEPCQVDKPGRHLRPENRVPSPSLSRKPKRVSDTQMNVARTFLRWQT
jgi:hypothetical protein